MLIHSRATNGRPPSVEDAERAGRLFTVIGERFTAEPDARYRAALADFERRPARHQEEFRRLLDDLLAHDPAFAGRVERLYVPLPVPLPTTTPPPHDAQPAKAAPRRDVRTQTEAPPQAGPPPLPAPLADLCDRLTTYFNLDELRDLALDLHLNPDDIPGTTLQRYSRGLILRCWRKGALDALPAAAARLRPHVDWAVSLAGLPAAPPPEFDLDDVAPVVQIIRKYIRSVFSDTRQVVTFMAVTLGVAAFIGAAVWLGQQPRCDQGDFTIAVAEFDQQPADARPLIGQSLSRTLAGLLSHELEDGPLAGVSICHINMPKVTTFQEAAALAQRLSADLIIYGGTTLINNRAGVAPRFYVNDPRLDADLDELNGDHALAAPFDFSLDELIGNRPPPDTLADRAALLTDFSRALVLLAYDDLPAARRAIDSATARTEVFGALRGVEVVYLFASHIARVQGDLDTAERYAAHALAANPAYGRGYIARANVLFDQRNYFAALAVYTEAATLPDQPPEARVAEKAALGAGNVYLAQLLGAPAGQIDCAGEDHSLAQGGLSYYQAVIDAHNSIGELDERLSGLAAQAYAYAGRIHHACGDVAAAAESYCAALGLPLPARQQKETDDLLGRLATAEEGIERCEL